MLATGIRRDQIHPSYRDLPVIGRGTTSLVLARDADTVLMLTRDRLKAEWLRDGLMIARVIDEYETTGHHIPGMDDLPVLVLEMPRLEPLSPENRKLANRILREFGTLLSDAIAANPGPGGRRDRDMELQALTAHYLPLEDHPLHGFLDWIKDYDGNSFQFDLHIGNFMQDRDGRLVLVDPVYSREIDDVIVAYRRAKRGDLAGRGPGMR